MIKKSLTDKELAYVLLRVVIGINLYMHGAIRVITGPGEFVDKMTGPFAETPLPMWMARGFLWALPFAEIVIGGMILLGLLMRKSLAAGLLLMACLTFGSTIKQDWSAAGSQLLYALVLFVLLSLREWNRLSVDDKMLR